MRTPHWFCRMLNDHLGPFVMDVTGRVHSVCRVGLTDGLEAKWESVAFCNPPFQDAGRWVKKAADQAAKGCRSVLLLPVGCSQSWYQKYILNTRYGVDVYYPDTRISYDNPDGTLSEVKHRGIAWYRAGADRDTMVVHFNATTRPCTHSTLPVRDNPGYIARRAFVAAETNRLNKGEGR